MNVPTSVQMCVCLCVCERESVCVCECVCMCVVNVSFMVVLMSKPQGELTPPLVSLAIPLCRPPPPVSTDSPHD